MRRKAGFDNVAARSVNSDYSIYEENNLNDRLMEGEVYEDNGLYICGVIRSEDRLKFQRVIFRSVFSRCNFNFMDIPEINKKFVNDIESNKVKLS